MMAYLWGAVILLHPYIVKISNVVDNRQGMDFFFSSAVIASCLIFGLKGLGKTGIILSIPVISNLLFQDDFNVYFAAMQNYNFIIGLLFIVHMIEHIGDIEESIHKVIVASCIGGVIFYIFNLFDINPRNEFINAFYTKIKILRVFGKTTDFGGMLNNPNVTGAYFAFTMGSFYKLNLKKYVFIPLLMTLTTSAWPIVTALSFLLYNHVDFKWKRPVAYLSFSALMIGLYFTIDHNSVSIDSARFLTWEWSLEMFSKTNVLFGNGLGWFGDKFVRLYKPHGLTMRQEHNEFLAALYAFGVVGLGLALAMVKKLSETKDKVAAAMVFAIFVNCACNFTFHLSSLFAICGIWIAIAYNGVINDKTMERKVSSR